MTRRTHRTLRPRRDVGIAVALPSDREGVDRVRHLEAGALTGAAGAPRLRIEYGELALRVSARANLRVRGRPVARNEMLFLAVEHQLDGSGGELREARADHDLRLGPQLAAKPAAHVVGDDADVRLLDLEGGGNARPALVHGLRGDPRRQPVTFPLADAAMCLKAGVRLDLRGVLPLDSVRRGLERRLDIPFSALGRLRDVSLLETPSARRRSSPVRRWQDAAGLRTRP